MSHMEKIFNYSLVLFVNAVRNKLPSSHKNVPSYEAWGGGYAVYQCQKHAARLLKRYASAPALIPKQVKKSKFRHSLRRA